MAHNNFTESILKFERKEVVRGIFWSGLDKAAMVAIQLLLELILARFLLPSDYGIMGVILIFITLGSLFAESGFSSALISKRDRDNVDFSTAFYFNLVVAVLFIIIITVSASLISAFFNAKDLPSILRFASLTILFNAVSMVYKTKLTLRMDFKTQAKVSLISIFFSGAVAVILAINGAGVWALAAQLVLQSFISMIFLAFVVSWLPTRSFSFFALRSLWKHASNLLSAGLLQNMYFNLYNIFIGRKISTATLGLYTKSNQFTYMPAGMISSVLQRVIYPFLSSHQNDSQRIFEFNQLYTHLVCLIVFPIFAYITIFAEPLVYYGLSASWLGTVTIIQLLAAAYALQPLITNNMVVFQAKNKTDLYFKVELITKIIGISILLVSIQRGIIAISVGILLQLVLQFFITSFFVNRLLGRHILSQVRLVLPYILFTAVLYIALNITNNIAGGPTQLLVGTLIFVSAYFVFYFYFRRRQICQVVSLIKSKEG